MLGYPATSDAEAYHVEMRENAGCLLLIVIGPPLIVAGLIFDAWAKLKERWWV